MVHVEMTDAERGVDEPVAGLQVLLDEATLLPCLRSNASGVQTSFFSAALLPINADTAIVVSSTTPITITDAPALMWTQSLASIFVPVNTRTSARPCRR